MNCGREIDELDVDDVGAEKKRAEFSTDLLAAVTAKPAGGNESSY